MKVNEESTAKIGNVCAYITFYVNHFVKARLKDRGGQLTVMVQARGECLLTASPRVTRPNRSALSPGAFRVPSPVSCSTSRATDSGEITAHIMTFHIRAQETTSTI